MGFSNVCVCCICLLGFDRQAWQKGSDRAVMNYRLVYGWFSRVFFFLGGGGGGQGSEGALNNSIEVPFRG